MLIQTFFKQVGKEKAVKYLNDYHTSRINGEMSIREIVNTLWEYQILEDVEEDLTDLSDYKRYTILGEYFIK